MADNTNDESGEGAVPEGTDGRVTEWFGQSVAGDTELGERAYYEDDPGHAADPDRDRDRDRDRHR